MNTRKTLAVLLAATVFGLASAATYAGPSQSRADCGSGWGPGMMGGHGSGQGMGPGMMNDEEPGGNRGPGVMHGYGPGMLSSLNLTNEQRQTIEEIQDTTHKNLWELTGKMFEEAGKLHQLLAEDSADRAALDAQYAKLQALRKQRFDIALDTHKKILNALTTEQREQVRHHGPWWMHDVDD